MSTSIEYFTFKPILILFRLLFLNTNISTKNTPTKLKYISKLLPLTKMAVIIYVWTVIFDFDQIVLDIVVYCLEVFQKIYWTLGVTLLYITSGRPSFAVPKLIIHIRKNKRFLHSKVSSPFLFIFIMYITGYCVHVTGNFLFFILVPDPYYSALQYSVFILGDILSAFYIAMICAFESLIYQEYRGYNQWLRVRISRKRKVGLNLSVIGSLSEQCRLLNHSFEFYMFWKMCYTYVSLINSVYYVIYLEETAWFNAFWVSMTFSQMVLIVYYHERRLKEVLWVFYL